MSHADRTAELHARALAARAHAYAPYSKFHVGAAVLMDGHVYAGANVENASYPLCVCAERNAIAAGVAAGARVLEAIVVVTEMAPPSSPCGGCRQVIAEFAAPDAPVIARNLAGEERRWTVAELLPDSFTRAELLGRGEER